MTDIYIGRQAIFNRKMEVYAYELLYRSGDTNSADIEDPDAATTQVSLNAIIEIGLNKIIDRSKAFINLTRNILLSEYPFLLPADRMIIQISGNFCGDNDLLTALCRLNKAGFTIALDDAVDLDCILPYKNCISIIKIDLRLIDPQNLAPLVQAIKSQGLLVLAEKVETMEEFNICHNLGVDFFQGYFLCKPNNIQGKKNESSRMVVMQTLAMLQDKKTTYADLEKIIAQDVNLSYKLLQLINSGYYSFISEVKSLRQAISLVGLDTFRGWMSLMMMTKLSDKPLELTMIALQRARMAESLARIHKHPQPEVCFMVGLFSVLDALMDMPMEKVIQEINLANPVTMALLYYEGLPGYILQMVLTYERGEWTNKKYPDMLVETISNVYIDSVQWTNSIARQILANASVIS